MPAASGEIYQVTYQQLLDGQTIENVIHFREQNGLSTPAQIATSAQSFLAALTNIQATAVTYINILIKQMTPVAFDEQIVTPTTTSGANAASIANNTVAQ